MSRAVDPGVLRSRAAYTPRGQVPIHFGWAADQFAEVVEPAAVAVTYPVVVGECNVVNRRA